MTDTGVGGMTTTGSGGSALGMGGSNRPGTAATIRAWAARRLARAAWSPARVAAAPRPGPCDVLAAAGNLCRGPQHHARLYQRLHRAAVPGCKGSCPGPNSCTGGNTKDIGSVGGYADSAAQDAFCAGATCTISIIYDQSPNKNHLKPAPAGGAKTSARQSRQCDRSQDDDGGHTVYGIFIEPGWAIAQAARVRRRHARGRPPATSRRPSTW